MRSHFERVSESRGAAAVEFAIIVPLLLLIIFALVDFGRLMYVEVSLNAASREGARASAVGRSSAQVVQVARDAAPNIASLSSLGTVSQITVNAGSGCPTDPGATDMTTVSVQVPFQWLTPLGLISLVGGTTGWGGSRTLQTQARMLCVG